MTRPDLGRHFQFHLSSDQLTELITPDVLNNMLFSELERTGVHHVPSDIEYTVGATPTPGGGVTVTATYTADGNDGASDPHYYDPHWNDTQRAGLIVAAEHGEITSVANDNEGIIAYALPPFVDRVIDALNAAHQVALVTPDRLSDAQATAQQRLTNHLLGHTTLHADVAGPLSRALLDILTSAFTPAEFAALHATQGDT